MYTLLCQCCNNKNKTIAKDTYKCSNCDHIYRNYLNDGIEYHTNQYRTKGNHGTRDNKEIVNNKLTNIFHEKRRAICTKRIEFISKILKKEYDLLDIGGGGGTFAMLVKEKVNNLDITELNPLCINECKRLGFKKVFDIDFLEINFEKKYDLITAWHVLEHIKDVNKFVDRLKLIAKKYVIIEVPIKSLNKIFIDFFEK